MECKLGLQLARVVLLRGGLATAYYNCRRTIINLS